MIIIDIAIVIVINPIAGNFMIILPEPKVFMFEIKTIVNNGNDDRIAGCRNTRRTDFPALGAIYIGICRSACLAVIMHIPLEPERIVVWEKLPLLYEMVELGQFHEWMRFDIFQQAFVVDQVGIEIQQENIKPVR